jgi:hypothetical protein
MMKNVYYKATKSHFTQSAGTVISHGSQVREI